MSDLTADLSLAPLAYQNTQDLSALHSAIMGGSEPEGDDSCPQIVGYQVGEPIGRGTYGFVWSATHLATGRRVAVKLLRFGPRVGLQREVRRILDVAEHPHVVPLLDAHLESDRPFLVTPLMQGSLGGYLRQAGDAGTIPPLLVRIWMRQVAGALEYVHERNVVHCDLKPDNILLDSQGNCRVCDFGQATLLSEGVTSLGTYFFMSPLQAASAEEGSGKVEPNWDIYSLGATFYYLSTGQYARGNPQVRSQLSQQNEPRGRLKVYRQLMEQNSLVPCRSLNPRIDPQLAQVIEKCLEFGEGGFGSAREVLQALDAPSEQPTGAVQSLYLRHWQDDMHETPFVRLLSGRPILSSEFLQLLMQLFCLLVPLMSLALLVSTRMSS
jgi:serine/threonine protein kinase